MQVRARKFGLPVGSGIADIIAQKLSLRLDEFHRVIAGSGDPQLFKLIRNQGVECTSNISDACKLITSGHHPGGFNRPLHRLLSKR